MLRSRLAVALCLTLVAGCDASDSGAPDPTPIRLTAADRTALAQSNAFGLRLFDRVAATTDANAMLSPLSASIALTMLLNSAAGETAAQIHDMLGYAPGQDIAGVNASYRSLQTQLLAADPDVRFSIANAVFYSRAFAAQAPFKAPFLTAMQADFDATVEGLDFANPTAVTAINRWASDATGGRIPRVVERISPDDVLFLMNALTFKGDWTTRFETTATRPGVFTRADGRTVRVPMMNGDVPVRIVSGDGYEAAELTYGRQNFSLVIVLPDAGPTSALATRLAGGLWDEIAGRLDAAQTDERGVPVVLPRFSFETSTPLKSALQALGMTDAFDDTADLTPMSDAGLLVSDVHQNTFVALDEAGTEAAAVTRVGVAVPVSLVVGFEATRPFVFVIRERTTGALLFVGQVTDPSP